MTPFVLDATDRNALEELYARFNRRERVHPDPVEFLHRFEDPRDVEVVGMIASSLAYGRVAQILASVGGVLERIGPSPCRFVVDGSRASIIRALSGFKHRFTTGDQLADLLVAIGGTLREHGSLQARFNYHIKPGDRTALPALAGFVRELNGNRRSGTGMLLPCPTRGSACKRLNLFLRWMIRSDNVDPGVWKDIGPDLLVVPLDTHMHRIALNGGLTKRRQADLRTAIEVTDGFRSIVPEDPVRYDFALTRLAMLSGRE